MINDHFSFLFPPVVVLACSLDRREHSVHGGMCVHVPDYHVMTRAFIIITHY